VQFESVRNFSSSTHTSYKATPIACCYMHAAVTRRINSIICTCTQASPWLTSSWRHRQVDEVKNGTSKFRRFAAVGWLSRAPGTAERRAAGAAAGTVWAADAEMVLLRQLVPCTVRWEFRTWAYYIRRTSYRCTYVFLSARDAAMIDLHTTCPHAGAFP